MHEAIKTFVFDIDGTLTVETEGHDYANRTPQLDRIKIVNELYDQGHYIILYSSRYLEDYNVTRDWLDKYGVPYHRLTLGKVKYDFWIDDKCVSLKVFFMKRFLQMSRLIK